MPLSLSATRELLERLGHEPKRHLGQNFLIDANIVRLSMELAQVRPNDVVVEVGPGLGTLTAALLEAGVEVWAVEKDATLRAHLTETLMPRYAETFRLMEADAVEHPLAGLPHDRANAGYLVIANLPYSIATPWLDGILEGPLPSRMVLMLQQEAAQRYVAEPGTKSFGAISVFLQASFQAGRSRKVSSTCFFPRPDVESRVVTLSRKPEPFVFPVAHKEFVRACFQQRRKQMGAILRNRLPSSLLAECMELLAKHGLSERTRPEAVPVACWAQMSARLEGLA